MNYNRNLWKQINQFTNRAVGSGRSTPTPPTPTTDTVTITTQPQDVTCYVDESAVFTVVAISSDETAVLSYQWQVLNNDTWANVSGATSSSYSAPTGAVMEKSYRVVVTSDKGGTATSNSADLTVEEAPVIPDTVTITTQPVGGYYPITLSVTAESDDETATLSYQWYYNDDFDWLPVEGATSSTYYVDHSGQYRCTVTSDKGGTATTNSVIVAQPDTVTITSQPVGGYIPLTLSVTAESNDETAVLSYQWQFLDDSWTDISGATTASYYDENTIGSIRCLVTSSKGGTATTNTITVDTPDTVTITTQPQSTSGYVGDTITLTVSAESDNWEYAQFLACQRCAVCQLLLRLEK